MCVCIGFVQYIQDRLTACLFISSDCCFYVYTFFFARSTGNISCCAAGICVQFMYDSVRLLFIGAVFSIGFSFIRPSYYCCCVCLLNAVKLAASSPLSLCCSHSFRFVLSLLLHFERKDSFKINLLAWCSINALPCDRFGIRRRFNFFRTVRNSRNRKKCKNYKRWKR